MVVSKTIYFTFTDGDGEDGENWEERNLYKFAFRRTRHSTDDLPRLRIAWLEDPENPEREFDYSLIEIKDTNDFTDEEFEEYEGLLEEMDPEEAEFRTALKSGLEEILGDAVEIFYSDLATIFLFEGLVEKLYRDDQTIWNQDEFILRANKFILKRGHGQGEISLPISGSGFSEWDGEAELVELLAC